MSTKLNLQLPLNDTHNTLKHKQQAHEGEQRLQSHRDQFGDTVAEEHRVDIKSREAIDEFVARHYRPACGQDAFGVGVTLGVGKRLDHVSHDHVGSLEAERSGVADVQLEDAVPLSLQPGGMVVYRTADLVKNVLQLG